MTKGGVVATTNFDVYQLRCWMSSTGRFEAQLQSLDSVGRLYNAINGIRSENLFDPLADYYVTNSAGIARDYGYTVQKDGTIIVTGNLSTEQVILKDPSKKIYPGDYELSGHVTFDSGVPDEKRKVVIRLLNAAYQNVNVKTERGGSTDVSNSALTGYFHGEFKVNEEGEFGFEIIGSSSSTVSDSLPLTVDQIYIKRISETDKRLKALKNIKIIPLNGGYPRFTGDYNQNIVFSWGDANVYVIENGKDRTTVTFEQIRAAIPSYATVDGTELTIAMPQMGVFGFDVTQNAFVMLTNYDVPETVKPLYYRYYTVCFGELANQDRSVEIALNNNSRMVYTTSTARHTIETNNSTGAITVTIGSRIVVRMQEWSGSLIWSDISSDIVSAISIDGDKATITIPNNTSLVLDTNDKLLHFRSMVLATYRKISDIVLIQNAWALPVRGYIYEEYINRLVEDMNENGVIDAAELRSQTFNAAFHTGAIDFSEKCQEFSSLLLGDSVNNVTAPTDFESFLFFTDPHLLEGTSSAWEQRCYEFMSQIQKYYNSTPTTFCLCGGDWLGNSDLPDQACFKMGYINGFMATMFNDSYLLVGNHDTNYQGKKDSESATYTTKLSVQSIVDLWYRKEKKAYYKFDGARTTFYCFDTGTENQSLAQNDGYQMSQAEWFAVSLLSDNSNHIALAMHIIYYNYNAENLENGIQPLTLLLSQISNAYNNRSTISVNGTTYDYSTSTGKVEFMIGGHYHQDVVGEMNGIPWIITTNVRHDESVGPSFDLVMVDYDNDTRAVKTVRVGNGENRTIPLS